MSYSPICPVSQQKNDQTFVLTMVDSFITLNEYNEITAAKEEDLN